MLWIRNGTLHTMEKEGDIRADLIAKNGKIAAMGLGLMAHEASNSSKQTEVTEIDATGLDIYPGFLDIHSHIGISEEKSGMDGNDCNEQTNPTTPWLRALDAINPMDSAFHNALAAGITGVMAGPGSSNPVGGQFVFLKTYGRDLESMKVLEPAAMKIAFGENPKTCYGSTGQMPGTRMAVAAMIREELTKAKRYCESGENDPDFRLACWRPVFEGKIPLKAHVHRADDILTAIRIAKEFGLGLTLDHCTEGHLIAQEVKNSGAPAIVGPSLASRSKNEVRNADFKTAGILAKAGVMVALTTDHPVSRIQYLPLCAALAAKEGLGEEEALRAISLYAAKIARVDHRLGSLRVGKDADFVIWRGSPLEVKSQALFTVINGEIVYRLPGKTA